MKEGWKEIDIGDMPFSIGTRAYTKNECRVIWSPMESHEGGIWQHLSISCEKRYPTWEEILQARYDFFDENVEVYQYLPPKSEYLNLHENCFHLWHKVGYRLMPKYA